MEIFNFWKNDTQKQTDSVLDNFYNYFSKMLKNCDLTIEIKRTRKSPTHPQWRYIWGYIVPTINRDMLFYGNEFTNDECYLFLKERGNFWKIKEIKIKNKIVKQKVYESFSAKNGDKKRIAEFIDWCIRWSAEYLSRELETPEEWKAKRGII